MGDLIWAWHRSTDVSLHTMVLVFVLLLTFCALAALTRGPWTSSFSWLGMLGLGVAWLQVNHRWEGDILFTVSASHGLTEADLLVPAVCSLALGTRLLRWAFTPIPAPARTRISPSDPLSGPTDPQPRRRPKHAAPPNPRDHANLRTLIP